MSEVTSTAETAVARSVQEIEKAENPFNKWRRILLANRWASASIKSFFYANNPTSNPPLTLHKDDHEALHDNDRRRRLTSPSSSSSSFSSSTERKQDDSEKDKWGPPPKFNQERRFKSDTGSLLLSRQS